MQTVVIGADGALDCKNDMGMTSAILQSSQEGARIFVQGLSVTGDTRATQPEAPALTPLAHPGIGAISHPRWESGVDYNYIDVGRNSSYRVVSATSGSVYGTSYISSTGDTTQDYNFRRVLNLGDSFNPGGSVSLTGVYYIDQDGVQSLPQEYYSVQNNTVLIAPAAPAHIVLQLAGDGKFSISATHGATPESVMPPPGTKAQTEIYKLYAQLRPEGFYNGITELRDDPSAVLLPRTSVNVYACVTNMGADGGNVTVRAYVGYTGDPAKDQFQKEFTAYFASGDIRMVSINLGAPSAPADNPDARPIITLVTLDQAGNQSSYSKLAPAPRSMDVRVYDRKTGQFHYVSATPDAGDIAQLARLSNRILQTIESSDNPIIARIRENGTQWKTALTAASQLASQPNLSGDEMQQAIAQVMLGDAVDIAKTNFGQLVWDAATALGMAPGQSRILLAMAQMDSSVIKSLFGSEIQMAGRSTESLGVEAKKLVAILTDDTQAMSNPWFGSVTPSNAAYSASQKWYSGLDSENLSAASRIYLGTLEQAEHLGVGSDAAMDLYKIARQVTGIPAGAIQKALTQAYTHAERTTALANLFKNFGYGSIFGEDSWLTTKGPDDGILSLSVKTNKFSTDDSSLWVSFDVASPIPYNHANVYVMFNGQKYGPLTADIYGKTFVNVPLDDIRHLLPTSQNGIPVLSWLVQLQLQIQDTNETVMPFAKTDTLDIEAHKTVSYSLLEVLGQRAVELTEADRNLVTDALNFGVITNERNAELIKALVKNYLYPGSADTNEPASLSNNQHRMGFDSTKDVWVGAAYVPKDLNDKSTGQCKWWVDDILLNGTLPRNQLDDDKVGRDGGVIKETDSNGTEDTVKGCYRWEENGGATPVTPVTQEFGNGDLASAIKSYAQAGDIVQCTGPEDQDHTMVLGAKTANGVWVFDSNYSTNEPDLAPRYHFLEYTKLSAYNSFTIYRLK